MTVAARARTLSRSIAYKVGGSRACRRASGGRAKAEDGPLSAARSESCTVATYLVDWRPGRWPAPDPRSQRRSPELGFSAPTERDGWEKAGDVRPAPVSVQVGESLGRHTELIAEPPFASVVRLPTHRRGRAEPEWAPRRSWCPHPRTSTRIDLHAVYGRSRALSPARLEDPEKHGTSAHPGSVLTSRRSLVRAQYRPLA